MARIIVTSRYLKSGNKKNLSNYVKYIATRTGAVRNEVNEKILPVTDNQKQLIENLLKDFPEGKDMFEYDDYVKDPNQKTASKLIGEIIERNSDRIANRENYVKYLGNRPGAVKLGEHGLFSQEDKPIDLKAAAKEIANHKGTVWTHVVSLRRDNAEQTGYTDLNSWRELVKRKIPVIAEASKISMKNLRWYAAFHDKETNPHVHIVVYSTNPKEGFLTNKGIEKIRSAFANDIYHDELYELYGRQTALRDDLKNESAKLMHTLGENIRTGNSETNDLIKSVAKLSERLSNCKGKLYYKYLPPEIKKTVDDIIFQLAGNDSIQKMYELWCEMEQHKHDIYSSAKVNFPPMTENKSFDSVKNMIIKTVSEMRTIPADPFNFDLPEPSDDDYSFEIDIEPLPEPEEYPQETTPLSGSNDIFKSVSKDDSKAKEYYEKALAGFKGIEASGQADDNLLYKIGQMYKRGLGTDIDTKTAIDYFRRAAELNNKNALRTIALEYISGENIEQDIDKGIEMLTDLSDSGDNLAAYKLGRIYLAGEVVFKDVGKAEKYLQQAAGGGNEFAVYSLAKLYLMDEKKDISKAAQLLEKACGCETIKSYAAYTYAKLLTDDNEFCDAEKAISHLEETAEDNNWFSFLLGQIYAFGKGGIERDKEKAVEWLTKSAEAGNEYAGALIQHIDDYEQAQLVDSIFVLFVNLSRLIEDDYSRSQRRVEAQVDWKLRKVMDQKKEALGIKTDNSFYFDY